MAGSPGRTGAQPAIAPKLTVQTSRYAPIPIISRYLLRQFFGFFLPILFGFIFLYLLVDAFSRMDILLRHQATLDASLRYFFFKIPLMVTQITPPAVICAVLLAFATLARHSEITALRSSGVSLPQTAIPLLSVAFAISIGTLFWNETVVPYCSHEFQAINNQEIRKRERVILGDRAIWYHGKAGFYHIEHIEKSSKTLYGLTVYRVDDDFRLTEVLRAPLVRWTDAGWRSTAAVEQTLADGAFRVRSLPADSPVLPEEMSDFLAIQREPEELSFLRLRGWIENLRQKGIDASHYLVDLHLKLALPFASLVLALVGVPIGGRVRRHPSVAAVVGLGIGVGFAYWVVLALGNSLGQSGAIPPVLAAWSANVVFTLLGAALFLYLE